MIQHLFAYGTLLPGKAPPTLVQLIGGWRDMGAATLPGTLYDFGDYPGAIVDPSASTRVHGRVFQLPDDERVLAALDAYEGFDPRDPAGSLFVRSETFATLSDGRKVGCWVYVYNRDPGRARLVQTGKYDGGRHDRER